MAGARYLLLSLAFGAIAVWASENMFWIVPPADLTLAGLALAWGAYSLCAAAALSGVILTGAGGLGAAFLGGALLGYAVEGVLVGTAYEAFPLQLVWTPLAWHGLLTGAVATGLARAPRGALGQAGFWLAVGLGATVWALYWPTERADLPGATALALYLVAPAALVALAHAAIDRLAPPPGSSRGSPPGPSNGPPNGSPHWPPLWALLLAPGALALLWLVQTVATLDPTRLVLPPVVGLVVLALRRTGGAGGWGAPRPLAQHALVLIAPLVVALLAPPLWAILGPQPTNIPFALATGLVGLGWLVLRVVRRPRAR